MLEQEDFLDVSMLEEVIDEFPQLFTKQGKLRKRGVHKYVCTCGNKYSSLKSINSSFKGIRFGSRECKECGSRVKDNVEYNVWKRMITGQLEQEDFILNEIKEKGIVSKDYIKKQLEGIFGKDPYRPALGSLVYFGYLDVDINEEENKVNYTLNKDKDFTKRYEMIR